MRKLYEQDIIEILYGATLLGAGGGGSLKQGLGMLDGLKKDGNAIEVDLLDLDEIGDNEYAAVVCGLGSPVAMEGNVSKARLNDRIVSVRNVNIPVEELQDHEKLCRALVEQSLLAIREDGAQAIVMGCTGFVDVAERIKHDLLAEGYDVPVLEAAQSALKLCEVYAKMGLRQSRLTYMTPPKRK